jgi:hypothetical protein
MFLSRHSLYSRLRAKVPEKRANFNSQATDRLWGGGAPASNNWASGAGATCCARKQPCRLLTLHRPQCNERHSALVSIRNYVVVVWSIMFHVHSCVLAIKFSVFSVYSQRKLHVPRCLVGQKIHSHFWSLKSNYFLKCAADHKRIAPLYFSSC